MRLFLFLTILLTLHCKADPSAMSDELKETRFINSRKLGLALRSSPGVPSHLQAEYSILNYMQANRKLFSKKHVLDIGTGNGIIALFAAKLGSSKVVATDINPTALQDVEFNSKALKLNQIEARRVDEKTPGAFAVIANSEAFDVIVSNPPYTLDLSAKHDGNFTDASLLGKSIIEGLPTKLKDDGVAILLYRNLFHHLYLVELAKKTGLKVKTYFPDRVQHRELEILFNSYAERLGTNAVKFNLNDLQVSVSRTAKTSHNPKFSGIIVISKSDRVLNELNDF